MHSYMYGLLEDGCARAVRLRLWLYVHATQSMSEAFAQRCGLFEHDPGLREKAGETQQVACRVADGRYGVAVTGKGNGEDLGSQALKLLIEHVMQRSRTIATLHSIQILDSSQVLPDQSVSALARANHPHNLGTSHKYDTQINYAPYVNMSRIAAFDQLRTIRPSYTPAQL